MQMDPHIGTVNTVSRHPFGARVSKAHHDTVFKQQLRAITRTCDAPVQLYSRVLARMATTSLEPVIHNLPLSMKP
jgi:hypothetical protein